MFYNVFYAADPLAYRIEPLLEERLARIPPISIPRFRTYPMGDGTSIKVKNSLTKHAGLFYPYCEVDVNRNSSKKHSHSSLEVEETSQDFSASLSVNPSSIAASKFLFCVIPFCYNCVCQRFCEHITYIQY